MVPVGVRVPFVTALAVMANVARGIREKVTLIVCTACTLVNVCVVEVAMLAPSTTSVATW